MTTGWAPKPPVAVPKAGGGARAILDPASMDTLIRQKGVRVRVFRTSLCPNVKSIDSAEHNIDCKLCRGGSGFLDRLPIDTMAFLQSQDFKRMHNPEGQYDGHTVAATFLMGIELQEYTLVELPDFQIGFYELVKRQEGLLDVLKYRAFKVNALTDQDGKIYLSGTDFTLDENGNLVWGPARGPQKAKIYSIHYDAALQFRSVRAMHVLRFIQVDQKGPTALMTKAQEQWMIQREFLVRRRSRTGAEIKVNKIRDSDEE